MDPLAQTPFDAHARKGGSLALSFEGRVVVTVTGREAQRLARRLDAAPSERDRQLLLAKATGNFRRGNER